MQVPFLPFPMTWGEGVMVLGLAYWLLRDTIKALYHKLAMNQWKSIIRKSHTHHV